MIKKYKKRPLIISAMKFNGDTESLHEAKEWLGCYLMKVEENPLSGKWSCTIGTLEGPHICSPGDYIIKGIKGEFYPCKPDIFEKTYKEVK